ncbi:MAG TPA: hypothetical protein VJV22_01485 [Acidobacteriaceae bacterium]|nr:hypothetical protein [Acidobacteriaceae bacterium]
MTIPFGWSGNARRTAIAADVIANGRYLGQIRRGRRGRAFALAHNEQHLSLASSHGEKSFTSTAATPGAYS